MDKLKAFVGLFFFDEKEWYVIPKIWIVIKNSRFYCYWPNSGHVEQMARQSYPHKSDWSFWEVLKIGEMSSKY